MPNTATHDDDFALDFAMFDVPSRPRPAAEEIDAAAARLARDSAGAAFRAEHFERRLAEVASALQPTPCVEVRHGSGRVKF